ncbi:hypothetical protein ACTXT7_017599 [Hymenolepis weldensis]
MKRHPVIVSIKAKQKNLEIATPESVGRVQGMMDENPGKSVRDLLPDIFKCLKQQQYIRNVVHQDFGCKSQTVNADADADAYVETL